MTRTLISLLHPSRSRPAKSFENSREWIEKAGCEVELIVSVDETDPMLHGYFERYGDIVNLLVNNNTSVVEATNHAAKKAKGAVLVYLSDDFKCPDNWGQLVLKELEGEDGPCLIKVDDCLQRFRVPVLTIPIMNRALYEKLGYFWHPAYRSMFVDEDLYWSAHILKALKFCEHLKFPHEHCSIGKCENDETYQRSAANWDQGKELFAQRQAAGFPLMKKLSILICTLPEERNIAKLARLRAILGPQLCDVVEVRQHEGGREVPTGTKRNELIDNCEGEYFCFVDDDDILAPTYVQDILKALESRPDVVTFNGWMTTNSKSRVDFVIKLGEGYEERDGKYYRWPNHLAVIRKSAVRGIRFEPIWMGEDYIWSKQIRDLGLLKTSVHIEKELYHYDFESTK
jgi:glycosyltransferase involved in cell wall biosynthesis